MTPIYGAHSLIRDYLLQEDPDDFPDEDDDEDNPDDDDEGDEDEDDEDVETWQVRGCVLSR